MAVGKNPYITLRSPLLAFIEVYYFRYGAECINCVIFFVLEILRLYISNKEITAFPKSFT